MRSDAHIGTGISKPAELDWVRRAREPVQRHQARRHGRVPRRQRRLCRCSAAAATATCCGPAWVAAYASRVEAMMRSYLRGGRSFVYWLTLPAPRPASFARVFPRVNEAIRRAARRVGGSVRVIDLVARLHARRPVPPDDHLPRPDDRRPPARRHPPLVGRRRGGGDARHRAAARRSRAAVAARSGFGRAVAATIAPRDCVLGRLRRQQIGPHHDGLAAGGIEGRSPAPPAVVGPADHARGPAKAPSAASDARHDPRAVHLLRR